MLPVGPASVFRSTILPINTATTTMKTTRAGVATVGISFLQQPLLFSRLPTFGPRCAWKGRGGRISGLSRFFREDSHYRMSSSACSYTRTHLPGHHIRPGSLGVGTWRGKTAPRDARIPRVIYTG